MKNRIKIFGIHRSKGLLLFSVLAFLEITTHPLGAQMSPAGSVVEEVSQINSLVITGTSNVAIINFSNREPVLFSRQVPANQTAGQPPKLVGTIPVIQFEADKPMVLHDFRKMLKSDEYPNILMEVSCPDLRFFVSNTRQGALPVELTIAGVRKNQQIDCRLTSQTGNSYLLEGRTVVKLSDFAISPPSKLFGLVRINDLVQVKVRIIFNPSDNSPDFYGLSAGKQ